MSDEYIFDEDGEFGVGDTQESDHGLAYLSQPGSNNNTNNNNNNNNMHSAMSSSRSRFYSLSGEELVSNFVAPLALKVSNPLCLSKESAIFLLASNGWSDERSITNYFEDETATCKKANLRPCPGDAAPPTKKDEKSYTCVVCNDTEEETQPGVALFCGHGACRECWRGYLKNELGGKGDNAWFCTCPNAGCKIPAAPAFDMISTTENNRHDTFKPPMENRLARLYASANSHMFARCSNPNCDRFIYCGPSRTTLPARSINNVVKCSCNQTTCVRCEMPNHLPATCDDMKKWDSKEQADSANANWMLAHTKQCPKCKKSIEKNEGCNHMTCSSCRNEFCWICMGDWSAHGSNYYNCNKPLVIEGRDAAANELERYIHYYTRYKNHDKSKNLDGITLTKARAKVEAMVRSGTARLHDADFWEKTALTLIAARRTLSFSYVYAFYLPITNDQEKGAKDLFEFQQGQLEHATETLSEYVTASNTGQVSAQDVVAKMSVTQQMLKNLEEGCMR